MRMSRCGSKHCTSDDLPTPDAPSRMLVWPLSCRVQFVETSVLCHAGEQYRITQRLIDRELRLPLRQLRFIQQIDLVDHDDRFDALYMRADQYAIQVQRIERDLRAEYHDEAIDIGRHEFAAGAFAAGQFAAPRQYCQPPRPVRRLAVATGPGRRTRRGRRRGAVCNARERRPVLQTTSAVPNAAITRPLRSTAVVSEGSLPASVCCCRRLSCRAWMRLCC